MCMEKPVSPVVEFCVFSTTLTVHTCYPVNKALGRCLVLLLVSFASDAICLYLQQAGCDKSLRTVRPWS